ncbi:MAG: hypothetical protein WB975_03015 [Nitrososphaeraceae archaeon]
MTAAIYVKKVVRKVTINLKIAELIQGTVLTVVRIPQEHTIFG